MSYGYAFYRLDVDMYGSYYTTSTTNLVTSLIFEAPVSWRLHSRLEGSGLISKLLFRLLRLCVGTGNLQNSFGNYLGAYIKLGYTLPSLGNNATANPLDDYS